MLGDPTLHHLVDEKCTFLMPLDEGSDGTSGSEGPFTFRKTPFVELSKLIAGGCLGA